jgi:predicted solute-binding protein
MVFAVWAGPPDRVAPLVEQGIEDILSGSLNFGLEQINTIVEQESRRRGFPAPLVHDYLTRHIRFRVGENEQAGMERFLALAAELEALIPSEMAPR